MKPFTIDGVYIEKALGKLKTAWNAVFVKRWLNSVKYLAL